MYTKTYSFSCKSATSRQVRREMSPAINHWEAEKANPSLQTIMMRLTPRFFVLAKSISDRTKGLT